MNEIPLACEESINSVYQISCDLRHPQNTSLAPTARMDTDGRPCATSSMDRQTKVTARVDRQVPTQLTWSYYRATVVVGCQSILKPPFSCCEPGRKKTAGCPCSCAGRKAPLAEIAKATDWQNHSIRGFISGTLTKKMGLSVESAKNEAGERTHRIAQIQLRY
jgi:hypothetical protein